MDTLTVSTNLETNTSEDSNDRLSYSLYHGCANLAKLERVVTIDHIGLFVSNYKRSKQFYQAAFAPLGYELVKEGEGWAGLGKDGEMEFWFGESDKVQIPMHIAFRANSRAQVNAFYQAAIAAGAKDNGKPGIREIYHPNYYGAFVIDPDGHNVEAVCHKPE